jgi:hypothetical protein
MNNSVINRSSNTIKVGNDCSIDSKPIQLDKITSTLTEIIGPNSNVRLQLSCKDVSVPIMYGVWNHNSKMGYPNSWIIVNNNNIVTKSFDDYILELSGTSNNYTITVLNNNKNTLFKIFAILFIVLIPLIVLLFIYLRRTLL